MKDYPNMSYCMYNNTANSMAQIVEAIDDKLNNIDEYLDTLSDHERESFVTLVGLCRRFVDTIGEHDDFDCD